MYALPFYFKGRQYETWADPESDRGPIPHPRGKSHEAIGFLETVVKFSFSCFTHVFAILV